jgi:TonB-dependent starch-binding outer membrane protein SusC
LNDAITPIPVAAQNGFVNVLANIGKMRNRGVDISLNAQVLTGKLTWRTTVNAGFNKNVILEIKNKNALYGPSTEGTVLKEGVSTSAIWGFNFAGVDPATGRELYTDKTGKVVSVFDLDRNIVTGGSYLGDRLPAVQGGFINSFGYKDFTFSINMLYSFGSKILVNNINENNGRNLSNRNQSVNLLDRWQKPGDITNIPLLSASSNPLLYTSSKYMYDNTYIKISNVSLAYTFSKKTFRQLKGTRITIYGNATNLFYWYKQDSPNNRNGVREYKFDFPEAQTFTTGAKISI